VVYLALAELVVYLALAELAVLVDIVHRVVSQVRLVLAELQVLAALVVSQEHQVLVVGVASREHQVLVVGVELAVQVVYQEQAAGVE
jgi:hypothetical protein